MDWVLEGFQHQVERQFTGRFPQRHQDRKWEYTLAAMAMKEAKFESMGEYIRRRNKKVAHFIATRSIIDLCEDWGASGDTVVAARRYRPDRGQVS